MNTTKISAFVILLISLLIAGVAAYFSISGLAQLFAAAMIPVIIMASVLELGKLATTFALHHSWKKIPAYIKYPAAIMVIILMAITSAGIFGYLSKGHLAQEQPIENIELRLEQLDQKITDKRQKIEVHSNKIEEQQNRIDHLDSILETLIDYDKISGPDGAEARRKQQRPEREEIQQTVQSLNDEITEIRDDIADIQDKKIELRSQKASVDAKLGPIKYVAELFGIDPNSDEGTGQAVRILIVILMAAFDPLAIVLIMLFDWLLQQAQRETKEREILAEQHREEQQKREEQQAQQQRKHELKLQQAQDRSSKKELQNLQKQFDELSGQIKQKDQEIDRLHTEHQWYKDTLNEAQHEIETLTKVNTDTKKLYEQLQNLQNERDALQREIEQHNITTETQDESIEFEDIIEESENNDTDSEEIEPNEQKNILTTDVEPVIVSKETEDTVQELLDSSDERIAEIIQENPDILEDEEVKEELNKQPDLIERIQGIYNKKLVKAKPEMPTGWMDS